MHAIDPPSRRMLVALLAPQAVGLACQQLRCDWRWPSNAWWTESDRLHMTLAQVVYLKEHDIRALRSMLRNVRFGPFSMRFSRARTNGKSLVLLPDECDAFDDLQRNIVAATRNSFFRLERPGPHMTLSRQTGGWLPGPVRNPCTWTVAEFCLIWSQLHQDVGRRHYQVLDRFSADPAYRMPRQLKLGF